MKKVRILKKKIVIGVLSVGVILSGIGIITSASINNDEKSVENLLTEQQATEIAEKAVNGTVIEMDLDEDDDQYVYEFEAKTSSGEAEVKINGVTGKVLDIKKNSFETVASDERASFPEYSKTLEQIDDQDYKVQKVTDNEGKRVLLLVDNNGKEQYKTIFIKKTNMLKIIDLDKGQIFSGII